MFTLPLFDDNPTVRTPFVTWLLIGLCVVVFLWQASLPPSAQEAAIYGLGVIPANLFGIDPLPPDLAVVPAWMSVVTSMFLHGGLLHLGGNMLFLWIFGNNVEDSMGHGRFIVFYLVCGAAAALAQGLVDPASRIPMVGASGAIAGVLGAYLLLHPQANVRVLIIIIFFIRLINVPAVIVLGFWFVGQVASGALTPVQGGGVAFWAHVGGFVAGMALIPFFKRSTVRLFDRPHSRSFDIMPPGAVRRRRSGSVPPSGRSPWTGGPQARDDDRRGPWD